MAYILDGSAIRAPTEFSEQNSTQMAVNRTLDGSIHRDLFGSNKRVWELSYTNVKKASYDQIKTIYDAYLATGTLKTWQITETNYTISTTSVHVDLVTRRFTVRGLEYLSDFTLVLTEA